MRCFRINVTAKFRQSSRFPRRGYCEGHRLHEADRSDTRARHGIKKLTILPSDRRQASSPLTSFNDNADTLGFSLVPDTGVVRVS